MRGFVTLAVGNIKYYKLAANLLKSYRYSAKTPLPFAIVADRVNKYTCLFDKTILLTDYTASYMDKLEILNHPPFDENIFIDADCLVYQDINQYWNYFPLKGMSCFGKALPLTSHDGWFEIDDVGDYKHKVSYIPQMHGGIVFFRNDALTQSIYQTACSIANDYKKYRFKYFDNPADEPILALSMAVHNSKPIELSKSDRERAFVFYPTVCHVDMDIKKRRLSYQNNEGKVVDNVLLLHWQNVNTEKPSYKIEVKKLTNMPKIVFLVLCMWYYISYYLKQLLFKGWRGIKRRLIK